MNLPTLIKPPFSLFFPPFHTGGNTYYEQPYQEPTPHTAVAALAIHAALKAVSSASFAAVVKYVVY